MTEKDKVKRIAGTSDEALKARTGKVWEEWFAILDAAGAMDMEHKDIARYLQDQQGVPDWWCQKITGGYEQERKGREKHQMPDGYQVSVNKTVNVSLAELYAAWIDEGKRAHWLQEPGILIRKATPERSMRITWVDGNSSLEALFTTKSETRSQVSLQHSKLPNSSQAEQMKTYWTEKLDQLKALLGG